MDGAVPNHFASDGQSDQEELEKKWKLQRAATHDRLMRELDELENYISSRAASIGSGVEYHPARIWIPGSIMAAMEFGDVFMRYYGLQFKFKQVLGPPGSAPKYNKNILDRAADYWRHQKEVATRVQTVQAEPSQSTSTNELLDQQQVSSKLEYPMHWSRWSISNEESVHSTLTDEIGWKRSFRIYKFDPRVYGGDEYYDLGLCRAHFTKSEICCLSWELCPFRHWPIEAAEETWVNPSWLATVKAMERSPLYAPDHPPGRYSGRPRWLMDHRQIQNASEGPFSRVVPNP